MLFIKISIDDDTIRDVAKIFANMRLTQDNYLDERFFPPLNVDKELQFGYFASMVAIDHRTSTPLDVFEGSVGNEYFHGADLLYRLGKELFDSNPEFFLPANLANLTWEDVKRLLSFSGIVLWDYKVRLFLLRDLGRKTLIYFGSFSNLFSVDTITELARRLEIYRAFEDPVRKKIYLLAKFLYGRNLVRFIDKENFEVAVDNHLSRIAIRLGIIKLSDYYFIEKQIEVPRELDIEIRMQIRKAWKKTSQLSNIDPFALDDFLWSFGRSICTREKPKCDSCPFKNICYARTKNSYWWEHKHTLTWYY